MQHYVRLTFHYMARKSFQFFVGISPNTHPSKELRMDENELLSEYALYKQISHPIVVATAVPVSSVPCE